MVEELQREIPDMLSVLLVDVVAAHGVADRVGALELELLAGSRALVVLGRHVGEDTVAQTQRGVAKAAQTTAVEDLCVHGRASNDDFGATGANTG